MSHGVRPFARAMAVALAVAGVACGGVGAAWGQAQGRWPELTAEMVKTSIARGTAYMATTQNENGSFGNGGLARGAYPVGPTALATLALLNSGVAPNDPVITRALGYIRSFHDPGGTYETSLVLMALVAAKDWDRDKMRIAMLAERLESIQTTRGDLAGMWNYGHGQFAGGSEDHSNTQFAILGLREAAIAGVKIRRKTWELTLKHFIEYQNGDGGWGYHIHDPSTGSMTCSGMGCLVICEQMLGSSEDDTNADGTPKCCNKAPRATEALRRAVEWFRTLFRRRRESRARRQLGAVLPLRRRAGRPALGPAILRQSRLVPRRGQLPDRGAISRAGKLERDIHVGRVGPRRRVELCVVVPVERSLAGFD